jgi:hypothetical protein
MPSIKAFSGVSQGWLNQVSAIATAAVRDGINAGANFMREAINNSPTSHPWHARKNDANNFEPGARIGNRNPSFGEVDPNSGNMLNSVSTSGPFRSGSDAQIAGLYGWLDASETGRDSYFVLQDNGDYEVGAGMGMGLINEAANGAGGVLRNYGAKIIAEQGVAKVMVSAGFKYTGSTF